MNDKELWTLFHEEADPQREFADTAEDNKEAIIKALKAVWNKAVDHCRISVSENRITD